MSATYQDSALQYTADMTSLSSRGQARHTLANVLNYLKLEKVDIAKLTEMFSIEKVKEMLTEIVENCFKRPESQRKPEGHIKLECGFATIPLLRIDVLCHSRYLWVGVMPVRTCEHPAQSISIFVINALPGLSKKINTAHMNADMLEGKYSPNHVGQAVRGLERKLAYIILGELLAYQFASPVHWIETHDLLFTKDQFERFVEIGPSPTLAEMRVGPLVLSRLSLFLLRGCH
ncbi:hypothetical protein HETIRDRAFT_449233 [Heterobasidion irregulare TC 32-1]|uniref:Uncharacterized protein n=1 Tax=Heterobasidion irregulare (strain TC 32-1) TaxID=747525 RepID=W4KCL1_HETIT|nr:uncharacterized protein HETIRDRAFT_449233 [Heterobasidion irregulare TC 32-1]ETW83518.1 hypothetical protein HETIRDRAFT_449233 [Heterobasidion irregulare TC 32-1]